MTKQNATLKTHELEVIGRGEMVKEPCQIGEWWVMPVEQYTGTIPPEAMKKWEDFKLYAQFFNVKVVGYLIGDDMREVEFKREQEAQRKAEEERQQQIAEQQRIESEAERQRREIERQKRKEQFDRAVEVGGKVITGIGTVLVGVAAGAALLTVGLIGAIIKWDPILIAVCEDGRWICVAAWWNDTEV